MNKNIMKYIGAFLLLVIVCSMITATPALAASAEVEISADNTEITVGDNIFVYITIHSDTPFGDFEANLTYDDDILEYQSGASVITGNSGFLKITDIGASEGEKSRKYTMKFQAIKTGLCEIVFNGRAMVYDYETGMEMSVSSNVITIDVNPAVTASDNAKLKSLKISPSQLNPSFKKDILNYTVNVDYSTEKLVVSALPEDQKATITISGNDNLKEGENNVNIKVLAESGAVIEYNINVIRENAPKDEDNIEEEPVINPSTKHGVFEMVRMDGEIYAIYSGKYKLVEPGSNVRIPDGYIKTKAILSDVSVDAYTQENDFDSEFLLIYAMNELGVEGFYQYDKLEKTLQRYVPASKYDNDKPLDTDEGDIMKSKEYRANLNKAAFVIALLGAFCTLLIVVLIRLLMKQKGYKRKK